MPTDHRAALASIKTFPQLIAYLHKEMGWPIDGDDFEELTFDFSPEELGIDAKNAAKIQEIKRLRPLSASQPWGIFFVKFEPKKLPVIALRSILSHVALKKRASANSAERTAWAADDLLFVSNYGDSGERQITFAHFSQPEAKKDLPTLKVLGWDNLNTSLHLDDVAEKLTTNLAWPADETDLATWRKQWRSAFTVGLGEPTKTSRDLSVRLAILACRIRDLIKTKLAIETDRGPLTKLLKAFQTSLVHDLDADGFADMYAQTIAYGLLSARIADPHKKTVDDFAGHMRTNPFLRELMETFLKVGGRRGKAGGPGIDFDELGVSEVVQLLDHANMEAVVLDFGDNNPQEDPVIHFYELFLKEYDAKKRMQRGVFYTPRPVVSYIVRSVDELLRAEFGLEDGLADTTTWGEMARRHKDLKIPEGTSPDQAFVQILDPATGTGTFLVEVIDIIHKTMVAKWKTQGHGEKKVASLWNDYVPRHLLTRLHAYELLMAPYAIAHLKVGLKLYETGYRFGSDERARIYLTNALEPASDAQFSTAHLPALAHEAEAVNEVKRHERFTVVLGNPPYFGRSNNPSKDASGDFTFIGGLVRRYFEVDGRPLEEKNPKWLQNDYVKFLRLAEWQIERSGIGIVAFITDNSYLDNPTFRGMRASLLQSFSRIGICDLHGSAKKKERTPTGDKDENVFDIMQGVAIGVFVQVTRSEKTCRFSQRYGSRRDKSNFLGTGSIRDGEASTIAPNPPFYLLRPVDQTTRDEYDAGVSVVKLMPVNSIGVVTGNDAEALHLTYEDAKRTARRLHIPVTAVRRILYRPFDERVIIFDPAVVTRQRLRVVQHLDGVDNKALVFTRSTSDGTPFDHVFCAKHPMLGRFFTDAACIAYFAPLYLDESALELQLESGARTALAPAVVASFTERLGAEPSPECLFAYVYGVLHSPTYRRRYGQFLKTDFPRIPLPGSKSIFDALVAMGNDLEGLHLLDAVPRRTASVGYDKSVTSRCQEDALVRFAISFDGPDTHVVSKVGWSDNTVWIDAFNSKSDGSGSLAGTIGFRGVPEAVWNFHIGGYQVCEKWLKDRKGRTLTKGDIAHYQKIVVALSETIRLMQEIDAAIEQHGGWPEAFQAGHVAETSAGDAQ